MRAIVKTVVMASLLVKLKNPGCLEKIYLQAKRYSDSKVRETDIRNFIGAMTADTSKGVFVTTSSFDKSGIVKASSALSNA